MPFGVTHTSLRALAKYATQSFFSRVEVENPEEIPPEGIPVIAVSNHWNSAVDPAVLSCFFPRNRKLHYWAKSTLFKPGFAENILLDAGNIPVDRKHKDNQKLFASTFDVLKHGEAVAIFPEGGSWTSPGLLPFKDGASWAALEYAKNIREKGRALSRGGEVKREPRDVVICIAGITYSDKTKYRSSVVMRFGKSIKVEPYVEEFMRDPKAAVKRLTADIRAEMSKLTVNSPTWESLNAATTLRKMLWSEESSIPLTHLRDIGQTLVDFFERSESDQEIAALRTLLLAYRQALIATKLTHAALSPTPVPSTLDPSIPVPAPTRFRVLASLVWSTCSSLVRLPFFLLPLLGHLPIYLIAKYSLTFSDLEEEFAQNKIALGLVIAVLLYPTLFVTTWCLLFMTPLGGILSFGFVWLFAVYHNSLIDNNYNAAKRLLAAWRVLVGIWGSHAKSEAAHALKGRFGIGDGDIRQGEHAVRRVLRLRVEAARAVAHLFATRCHAPDDPDTDLLVKLVEWGAIVPTMKDVATPASTPALTSTATMHSSVKAD